MNEILIISMVSTVIMAAVLGLALRALVRSSRAANALVKILTNPAEAKMDEAKQLMDSLAEKHLSAANSALSKISHTIEVQTARTEQLSESLTRNTGRLENLTSTLDTRMNDFTKIVNSDNWENLTKTSKEFSANISELFSSSDNLAMEISDRVDRIKSCFEDWTEDSKRLNATLAAGLESGTAQMNSFNIEGEAFSNRINTLMTDTGDKFGRIRDESAGLSEMLTNNEKLVDAHMDKIATYTRQSKMLLDQQLGGLTNTASAVGSQIRLAESSIDKQQQILEKSVQTLMEHATDTEGFVKGISSQITTLTGRLQNEVREMIGGMLESLQKISENANAALVDTGKAQSAFSENVSVMSHGIKETLSELDGMNSKMITQASGMIEMSRDVTAHLQPLTELIAGYHKVLPELGRNSAEITDKLKSLSQTTNESVVGMANSSFKLEKLTEQSRQMMIELLSDYSDALNKMEKLSTGMESARTQTPAPKAERAQSTNESAFMSQAHGMLEKLNEISLDLVQATNTEIPDTVWDRYRGGDKAVFAKWFAKIVSNADKRRFQNLYKTDAAFRGNATLFMRSFHKMLLDASQDENKDAITATLLKTDIGRIYLAMKELIS